MFVRDSDQLVFCDKFIVQVSGRSAELFELIVNKSGGVGLKQQKPFPISPRSCAALSVLYGDQVTLAFGRLGGGFALVNVSSKGDATEALYCAKGEVQPYSR